MDNRFLSMSFHKFGLLVSIFLILIPQVSDGDFWLHLRTGEIIIENGVFPRVDVLSFTGKGKEWINHEWLPQSIFYLLFKYSGFMAISLFTAFLAGAAVFALIMVGKKLNWLSFLFLFLIAYSLKPFIVPRPQIFAYLMLISLILAIDWYYRTKNRKIVFILPLVLLFWSNFHASVILALPVLMAVLAFEFGPIARFNKNRLENQERNILAVTVALVLGTTLVNPFGYKIYWQALQPLRFSEAYHALLETQPIYKTLFQPLLLITHLTIIFAMLWHLFKKRLSGLRFCEVIIFTIFMAMPFLAVKYTPFAWVATLPIFLKIMPNNFKRQGLLNKFCLLIILTLSVFIFWRNGNLFKNPHDEWPKEMMEFIESKEIKGNIYNPYAWGGYISWKNKYPAFTNVAVADIGGDVFWDGLDFEKGEKVEEIIEKYNLSAVISQPWVILPYTLSLKDDWSLVYWDNLGVIFLRKDRGNDRIISEYGLDIKYFNDSVESVLKKYTLGEIPNLILNYHRVIERQPDLLLGRFRLGLIYQTLGYCPKAIEQYKEIIKLDIKLGSVHFRLAECYREIGDYKSALAEKKLADKYRAKERWWKGRR